jgi:ATP adenylyltransferase
MSVRQPLRAQAPRLPRRRAEDGSGSTEWPSSSMDYIWTPWRYRYIAEAGKIAGCVFCDAPAAKRDEETLLVLRGVKNYVILNRYPYTSGHVMIVPYAHTADFGRLDPETSAEIMQLAQRVQAALDAVYHPEGYNLGMNLGRSAGAGIADHLHMHLLPRWTGDTNFMTSIGETRLEPEDLSTTYGKLRRALGL